MNVARLPFPYANNGNVVTDSHGDPYNPPTLYRAWGPEIPVYFLYSPLGGYIALTPNTFTNTQVHPLLRLDFPRYDVVN